ncbi:MAG: hypothetical protein IJB90_00505 [Clostridia bacterium]|nr:hypothetical protein [Clostridia bacterium]
MIVFWIVIGFVFFISFLIFIICLSYVEIEVKKFKFNSNYEKDKRVEDYLIYMRFKFLNKITWMKLEYKKTKKHKIFNHKMINKVIDFKDVLRIRYLKYLNPKVDKIDLNVKLDSFDTVTTSLEVGIVSIILSIILANRIDNYNSKNYNYSITPIYGEQPQILITLNCIFNVKLVHIINIVYMLLKKRSGKYDERTSDRRTYACRNE